MYCLAVPTPGGSRHEHGFFCLEKIFDIFLPKTSESTWFLSFSIKLHLQKFIQNFFMKIRCFWENDENQLLLSVFSWQRLHENRIPVRNRFARTAYQNGKNHSNLSVSAVIWIFYYSLLSIVKDGVAGIQLRALSGKASSDRRIIGTFQMLLFLRTACS